MDNTADIDNAITIALLLLVWFRHTHKQHFIFIHLIHWNLRAASSSHPAVSSRQNPAINDNFFESFLKCEPKWAQQKTTSSNWSLNQSSLIIKNSTIFFYIEFINYINDIGTLSIVHKFQILPKKIYLLLLFCYRKKYLSNSSSFFFYLLLLYFFWAVVTF